MPFLFAASRVAFFKLAQINQCSTTLNRHINDDLFFLCENNLLISEENISSLPIHHPTQRHVRFQHMKVMPPVILVWREFPRVLKASELKISGF